MTRRRAPLWFTLVAVALLLWGAAGVFACIQQIRLGAEAMGPSTAYDRALHAALPGWYNLVYAVATGAGLAGAVALLVRSGLAPALFGASLVAVVLQFGWLFATTDIVAHKGAGVVVPFPVVIALIALGSVLLARRAQRRGWIG